MSTKIHRGRVISAPLFRAYQMLMELKPEIGKMGEEMQHRWMVEAAVNMIDREAIKGSSINSPLIKAWTDLIDRHKACKATMRRDPEIDFEFDLWLFPLKTKTLLIVQTEQNEFLQFLDRQPFIEDYSYWDNADRNENITAEDWRKRKKDWDLVLPMGSAPSDRCLVMAMFNSDAIFPPDVKKALKYVPAMDRRIDTLTKSQHLNEVYSQLVEKAKSENPDYKPEGFGLYYNALEIVKKQEDRHTAIHTEISGILNKITSDDLISRH